MDISILIPSRNEMFLSKTVEDILANAESDFEVLVGLDGAPADPPLPENPRVKVIYHETSIGQRAITNELAKMATGKYVMKVDAHCAFDKGFDSKMLQYMEPDITMVPVMRNLHAFDWVCPDGHRRYQGPSGPCTVCGKETTRDVKWIAKENPQSTAYRFDTDMHFQYWGQFGNKQKGNLTETLSLQGSCFMCTKEKYFELDLCSEEFSSWGQQGVQIACTTWLSGGRVMINRTTFYGHMFRTKGGDFGFPYDNPQSKVVENRRKSKDMFWNNKWPKQIHPSYWLLEKFWPVPSWTQKELDELKLTGRKFMDSTVLVSSPNSITGLTIPVPSINVGGQKVSPLTMSHSGLSGTGTNSTQNISSVSGKTEVVGVATQPVATDMVNNRNVLTEIFGDGPKQPSINNSVDTDFGSVKPNPSVTEVIGVSSPNPASSLPINSNLGEKSGEKLGIKVSNSEHSHSPHIISDKGTISKGILYYTDNLLDEKIMKKCQEQLKKVSLPIVSVSLKPLDFGKNIVLPLERGLLTMSKQILVGLETMEEDIVFMCEHDVLYHPSHFDFTPTRKDVYYYNTNSWMYRYSDGHCLYYFHRSLSGMCAYRKTLITHYRERLRRIEALIKEADGGTVKAVSGNDISLKEGIRRLGFEPGTHTRPERVDTLKCEDYRSQVPNVDIRHDKNETQNRWKIEQFRNKPKNWQEADKVPGWEEII